MAFGFRALPFGGPVLWQGAASFNGAGAVNVPAFDGEYDENGTVETFVVQSGQYVEFEYGLQIQSGVYASNDVLTFQVWRDGAPVPTYAFTPQITITAALFQGAALFDGTGNLKVNGFIAKFGSLLIDGAGGLAAAATLLANGRASLAGTGGLNVTGFIAKFGNVPFNGTGFLAASASLQAVAASKLQGAGGLNVNGFIAKFASANLSGTGGLKVDGTILSGATTYQGAGLIDGTGDFEIRAQIRARADTSLAGVGSLSVNGLQVITGSSKFDGAGALNVNGFIAKFDGASLAGTGALVATGQVLNDADALLAGTGRLNVDSFIAKFGAVPFNGTGFMVARASLQAAAAANLGGAGALSVDATVYVSVEQEHFRFRTDTDFVNSPPIWGTPEDDTTFYPGTAPFRLRVGVKNKSGSPTGVKDWQLMVSKNGGPYSAVTTSSTGVKAVDAGSSADGDVITDPDLTVV